MVVVDNSEDLPGDSPNDLPDDSSDDLPDLPERLSDTRSVTRSELLFLSLPWEAVVRCRSTARLSTPPAPSYMQALKLLLPPLGELDAQGSYLERSSVPKAALASAAAADHRHSCSTGLTAPACGGSWSSWYNHSRTACRAASDGKIFNSNVFFCFNCRFLRAARLLGSVVVSAAVVLYPRKGTIPRV